MWHTTSRADPPERQVFPPRRCHRRRQHRERRRSL